MKRALSALGAVAFALTLSACPAPPECEVNGDCEGTEVCSEDGTCEPDPRPVRCDNGLLTCATTEVCDEVDGACKTCTATAGCSAGAAICDTAANNGMGVCKTCLSDNTGCGETAPICDTGAGGGLGACIVCNATLGCRASQGETCDTAANGGAGACVSCLGDSECTEAGATVCTAGACVACRDDQTGTTPDQGCSDVAAPLCGAESTCKACLDDGAAAAADTGCDSASATPACYGTGASGAGACVQCTTNEHCSALTETPFCHQASNTCAATESGNALTEIAKIRGGTATYPASVTGAMVTNVRPATGTEPAGFFVQGTRDGLGLFVLTLGGFDPQPGDLINMTVASVITTDGLDRATITAGTIVSSGNDLSIFVTDISERTTWAVADVEALESKLVSGTGTLEGALFSGGTGHLNADFDTDGNPNGDNLRVRFPSEVAVDLEVNSCVGAGSSVSVNMVPMWRFSNAAGTTNTAQPMVFAAEDITFLACPDAAIKAVALSSTEVRITFNRSLDTATVLADGSQFTFNGLTASAATVAGKTVTVTTTAQTPRTDYTVTIAPTLKDRLGFAVSSSPLTFDGYSTPAVLMVNEVHPNISTTLRDMVELYVVSAGNTSGMTVLQDVTEADRRVLATLPDAEVAAGDVIVVHLFPNPGADGFAAGSETSAKNEFDTATYSQNYDGAWDFYGPSTNATQITYSSRIISVTSALDVILDAVPFTTGSSPPAIFTANFNQIRDAGLWTGTCAAAACTSAEAMANSVSWASSGNTPTGNATQRLTLTDTNSKADWTATPIATTFGAANVGQ